jgi:hypothetical protein
MAMKRGARPVHGGCAPRLATIDLRCWRTVWGDMRRQIATSPVRLSVLAERLHLDVAEAFTPLRNSDAQPQPAPGRPRPAIVDGTEEVPSATATA